MKNVLEIFFFRILIHRFPILNLKKYFMLIKKEVLEVRDFILSENDSKLSYYEAYDLAIKLVVNKLVDSELKVKKKASSKTLRSI